MKDVVIKAMEYIAVQPNERYSMPDEVADLLVARGKAEIIEPVIVKQEEKSTKKGGK